MSTRPPTQEQLRRISRGFGLNMDEAELESYGALIQSGMVSYDRLDQLAEPSLEVRYPRSGGQSPEVEDNPLNAWYQRCSIRGASEGSLAGKRLAIKDNVGVAGVPMMTGTSTLEGYTPEFDATVVTRILDAGGEIVGKAVCEHLCLSGGSHTSDSGPVLNPHDHTRSAGGSSSGSAALVANGDVDMAIGGDQGGSIRMPASWCGIYGLKPTHGLVPYTGIFPVEMTIDHTGPIAATVTDIAVLLEAVAGEDGLDPRQNGVRVGDYTASLDDGAQGLKIGTLDEGFGWPGLSEEDVDDSVRQAAGRFEEFGAEVGAVSAPLHRDGLHIWTAIANEGATEMIIRGNSMGTNWKGHYATSLVESFGRGRKAQADDLSETVKLTMLAGEYMREQYHGRYYARAQNLVRRLTAAYDEALERFDLLALPTLPMKATPLPEVDAPIQEIVARALEMIPNTAPSDLTGHPAITVPCGFSGGLPVGMMLVGRRWDEATVLKAARAFEKSLSTDQE